jgi:transposase
MPDMRKGSASAGAKQLSAMCGHTVSKVKAYKAKKKAMLAANGGKPLRKAETNEQTARAIERRKRDIRAIRRLYWECHLTVSEIAEQSQGRYSEQWIQDCVLYRFERVLV